MCIRDRMYTTPLTGTNVRTPMVGFNFDPVNVSNEVANLTNEIITSIYPIKFGVVDYDSNIDQAIQRLKAAGLDKVLEEYSKQYKEHYLSLIHISAVSTLPSAALAGK